MRPAPPTRLLFVLAAWACAMPAVAMAADWAVEVSQSRCIASQETDAGLFELNGLDGDVGFALFAPRGVQLPQGMQGVLEIDARRVMFTPSYVDDETDALYFDGALSDADLRSLRSAREVRIAVDGQHLAAFAVGVGLPKALDGLIACSRGKRGAWGAGVPSQR